MSGFVYRGSTSRTTSGRELTNSKSSAGSVGQRPVVRVRSESCALSSEQAEIAKKRVRELFSFYADANRDGFLDLSEFGILLEELGMDPSNTKKFMKLVDTNGDGRVDTTEMLNWLFKGSKEAGAITSDLVERTNR
eukprot:TRINITY_DN70491_c0_g1_i1.p1 TRINITY_DN70491_c0_g1~~TRINITY_DN70491_c0_g1_i1.p1  ORF type:complete len:136 (-),score=23.78 TRINITY_DN70491_c0_g1_i1:299-706(-)